MSSIKIKDESGNWILFGGTAQDTEAIWTDINLSTFYIPVVGGNFNVTTAGVSASFVVGVLPLAPTNGTIVRMQPVDINKPCYLQAQSPDTIDYQPSSILARSTETQLETVRYYNGRWLRIEGSSSYQTV